MHGTVSDLRSRCIVLLPVTSGGLLALAPLYEALRRREFQEDGECMVVEGMPVQFLPAFNPLLEEALAQARETRYAATTTRVLRPEHLAAIVVQTGRDKDRQRFTTFVREAVMDEDHRRGVLERHQLIERFTAWKSAI